MEKCISKFFRACFERSRNTVVGRLGCGLDGPWFESRLEQEIFLFSETPRPALRSNQPPCSEYWSCSWTTKLTIHIHLVARLRMSGTIALLRPYMPSWSGEGKCIFLVVWNKCGHYWNSEPYVRKWKKDVFIAAAMWKYVLNCLLILHFSILTWRWSLLQNLSYIDYAMPAVKLTSHRIPNYNNVWFLIMNPISHNLSIHDAIFIVNWSTVAQDLHAF